MLFRIMRGQYEELSCPFCDKGKIQCWYIPESYKVRHVRSGKGKSNIPQKSSEVWLIQSGCNICGKSSEEVKKELRKKEMI